MNSHYTTALVPYLKRIKLVAVALALVFLANLGWGQFAGPGGAKPHCTMTASQYTDANTLQDCCPKRGEVPPNSPSCCKYPCYTQAVTQVPILLGAADIAVAVFPVELPHRHYRERLLVAFSPPELRPPII